MTRHKIKNKSKTYYNMKHEMRDTKLAHGNLAHGSWQSAISYQLSVISHQLDAFV